MTDIEFESEGILLKLNLIEIDDFDSNSMKWSVKLTLSHPTGAFSYHADDVWLSALMWDDFVSNLKSEAFENAVFFDQSRFLIFSIRKMPTHLEVEVKAKEPLVPKGTITMETRLNIGLDSAFLHLLKDSFEGYAKFW